MANQQIQIIEGTWEELLVHAEEFKDRKLRLIVLPEETQASEDNKRLHEAAAKIIEEADKSERQPGKPSDDPYETAFGDIIADKFRKLGFKL